MILSLASPMLHLRSVMNERLPVLVHARWAAAHQPRALPWTTLDVEDAPELCHALADSEQPEMAPGALPVRAAAQTLPVVGHHERRGVRLEAQFDVDSS